MSTQDARALVMAYGWNATAYQILNPGISHWFAPQSGGVVGYIRRCNMLLVVGAPVCPLELLSEVVRGFENFARRLGCSVCFVCAAERLRALVSGWSDHSSITLGAQPAWDPQRWRERVLDSASLRAQLNRACNKGVTVAMLEPGRARDDPGIAQVLEEWLLARALPPMGFMVEPRALNGISRDRLLFVARYQTKVAAFLVASPVAGRNGYLIEQVIRSPRAPNGTAELLIDRTMARLVDEGRTYATLGLVAFTRNAVGMAENPLWFRLLSGWARAYANGFYNFKGLEQFRLKLMPEWWEASYAISNKPRFSIRTLYAVGKGFAGTMRWHEIGLAVLRMISRMPRGNRQGRISQVSRAVTLSD